MKLRIISQEKMKQYIQAEDVLIIDVRSKEKYLAGHLPRAVWMDWEFIEEQLENYLFHVSREIVWIILYCDHGNRSLYVARDLARLGYPVISLSGGFSHWKGSIEKKDDGERTIY